jgi:hypothetical protein
MANETNITCPKCGAEIPLTEAVSHRVREQLVADFEKQRQTLNAAMVERENKLTAGQQRLEQQRQNLQSEVSRQLDESRKQVLAEAARQAEDKLGAQLKDLQSRLDEQRDRLKEAREAELALRKEQRALQEAKEALELEVQRKLDAERQNIVEAARQQAMEVERLKLADKDNKIKDLQEQIAALQQRAEQGSMQSQGETLELDLEDQLRGAFPFDEILEVKKGQRGADVTQRVRTNTGLECGSILWEAKRAKSWSADWPEKLKEDQRLAKSELAVIVTTCPPAGVRGIGQVDGVWICQPHFAGALAGALREGLVSTAAQRLQETGRADKMSLLYDYLCGVEFRQHVQAIVESFELLREQLAAEQRAFARQWKEREQQIEKAVTHTAMLYGGIQGIAGREALPEIKPLALPEPENPQTGHSTANTGE